MLLISCLAVAYGAARIRLDNSIASLRASWYRY